MHKEFYSENLKRKEKKRIREEKTTLETGA